MIYIVYPASSYTPEFGYPRSLQVSQQDEEVAESVRAYFDAEGVPFKEVAVAEFTTEESPPKKYTTNERMRQLSDGAVGVKYGKRKKYLWHGQSISSDVIPVQPIDKMRRFRPSPRAWTLLQHRFFLKDSQDYSKRVGVKDLGVKKNLFVFVNGSYLITDRAVANYFPSIPQYVKYDGVADLPAVNRAYGKWRQSQACCCFFFGKKNSGHRETLAPAVSLPGVAATPKQ